MPGSGERIGGRATLEPERLIQKDKTVRLNHRTFSSRGLSFHKKIKRPIEKRIAAGCKDMNRVKAVFEWVGVQDEVHKKAAGCAAFFVAMSELRVDRALVGD